MRDEGLPTTNAFAQQIEELVWDLDVPYMDAVILWCEKRGLEPEIGAGLVKKSAPLKAKIKLEAEELSFLPKSGGRLPV